MAGAVGTVRNTSQFASFIVKDWQPWMTEAVILHASGMSVPELRVKFQRGDQHIRNILNTEQAKEIVRDIQARALKQTTASVNEKIIALRQKALANMEKVLDDPDEQLSKTSPFAFLEASRKVYETVSKHDAPLPAAPQTNIQQNFQQNIIGSVSPELMDKLRGGPSLQSIDVPDNVEYLGALPPRELPESVHDGRVSGISNQSKNGLALVGGKGSSSSAG